jgi:hypothetical protein
LAIAPYELKRRSSDEVGSTFDAESQQYNNGISQLFEARLHPGWRAIL